METTTGEGGKRNEEQSKQHKTDRRNKTPAEKETTKSANQRNSKLGRLGQHKHQSERHQPGKQSIQRI